MTVNDYKDLCNVEILAKRLSLEFNTKDEYFCISNEVVILNRFNTIQECLIYLKGYHQSRRIYDSKYNNDVLKGKI